MQSGSTSKLRAGCNRYFHEHGQIARACRLVFVTGATPFPEDHLLDAREVLSVSLSELEVMLADC